MVACKPDTVERLLGVASGSSRVYVPASVNDDPCFRVCFGAYATSKEGGAADLPGSSREGENRRG
jgi:hypothetical protein